MLTLIRVSKIRLFLSLKCRVDTLILFLTWKIKFAREQSASFRDVGLSKFLMNMGSLLRQIGVNKLVKIPDKVLTLPVVTRMNTISSEHPDLGGLIPLTKICVVGLKVTLQPKGRRNPENSEPCVLNHALSPSEKSVFIKKVKQGPAKLQ